MFWKKSSFNIMGEIQSCTGTPQICLKPVLSSHILFGLFFCSLFKKCISLLHKMGLTVSELVPISTELLKLRMFNYVSNQ